MESISFLLAARISSVRPGSLAASCLRTCLAVLDVARRKGAMSWSAQVPAVAQSFTLVGWIVA